MPQIIIKFGKDMVEEPKQDRIMKGELPTTTDSRQNIVSVPQGMVRGDIAKGKKVEFKQDKDNQDANRPDIGSDASAQLVGVNKSGDRKPQKEDNIKKVKPHRFSEFDASSALT